MSSTLCLACSVGFASSSTGASSCSTCDAGQLHAAFTAVICVPVSNLQALIFLTGQYQSAQGQTSCISCQSGRMGLSQGASSSSQCTACEAGQFQEYLGRSSCRNCGAGRYSSFTAATSASQCISCAEGQHQGQEGSSSCTSCGAGRYLHATTDSGDSQKSSDILSSFSSVPPFLTSVSVSVSGFTCGITPTALNCGVTTLTCACRPARPPAKLICFGE